MVTHLGVIAIYFAIGALIGTLIVWGPNWREHRILRHRLSLFFILLFLWLPLSAVSFIVGPFIHVCKLDSNSH